MKPPLQEALQVDPEVMASATFLEFARYGDALVCMEFEGIPMPGKNLFDDNTYFEMRHAAKIGIDSIFTTETRRLGWSRLFRKPVREMYSKVACLTTGCPSHYDETLKYLIYSAHDD